MAAAIGRDWLYLLEYGLLSQYRKEASMTRLEEIMLECCELTLDEVRNLHKFLDLLESKKQETAAFCAYQKTLTSAQDQSQS